MLSTYDMQCLGRLEDRWADPDYNTIPEDEEPSDLDFLRGDDDYIERWTERRIEENERKGHYKQGISVE